MEGIFSNNAYSIKGDADWPTAPPKSARQSRKIKVEKFVVSERKSDGIFKQFTSLETYGWEEAG